MESLTREDAYNASASAMSMYGGLFKSVVKELGMEKALEMHARQGEHLGDELGKALKKQLGSKKIDIKALNQLVMPMMNGFGFDMEVKENPKSLVIEVSKCPMYDGFKMAGLDHETIEKMCSTMSNAEYVSMMKHYPELKGRVKFRGSPSGVCREEFVIK